MAKHSLVMSTNFLFPKVDNAQQCLPLHLKQTFPPIFEFSLKVKVMRLNPGYLLKSFLLYFTIPPENTILVTENKNAFSWNISTHWRIFSLARAGPKEFIYLFLRPNMWNVLNFFAGRSLKSSIGAPIFFLT